MKSLERFRTKKIIYISGKGGVGKSTLAAAIAMKLGGQGQESLLVELGDESYFESCFPLKTSAKPQLFSQNSFLSRWTGIEVLGEYVDHLVRLKGLGKVFFENPVMENLLKIAPGLFELAILGKLSSGVRKHGPELSFSPIVLDAYATGHSLAMLRAPKVMTESIQVGPMHTQSESILQTLSNKEITQFLVVSNCEEIAMEEALEHCQCLRDEFGIEPMIVLNRTLEEFSVAPDLSVSFESFLYYREEEQKKARELLRSSGIEFLEVKYVFDAQNPLDLFHKVGHFL